MKKFLLVLLSVTMTLGLALPAFGTISVPGDVQYYIDNNDILGDAQYYTEEELNEAEKKHLHKIFVNQEWFWK